MSKKINGANIIPVNFNGLTAFLASLSLYFIAYLFGTSSPKTRVMKDSVIVIRIMDTVLIAPSGMPILPLNPFTIRSAKESAANALDKNPANVTPTCIVDKNLLEFFTNSSTAFDFLLPSSADFVIFASLKESKAISADAKNAFKKINTIINMICRGKCMLLIADRARMGILPSSFIDF